MLFLEPFKFRGKLRMIEHAACVLICIIDEFFCTTENGEMFRGTEIIFVSASSQLLEAARAEGFQAIDPVRDPIVLEQTA